MKNYLGLTMAALMLLFVAGCKENAEETGSASAGAQSGDVELDTMEKKISYIFGYNVARQTMRTEFYLDPDILSQAIRDVHSGAEPRFTEEEIAATIQAWRTEERARAQELQNKAAEENIAAGKAFLEENAKQEGVVQTESGLQYKVLQAGEGASPSDTDKVKVHYRGTLLDGTEFDSSYKRNEPAEFVVGRLIPGWIEALQIMKEGDKFEIYVPANLGYGPGGTGNIPPNSTLKFEMELLEILDDEQAEGKAEAKPAE